MDDSTDHKTEQVHQKYLYPADLTLISRQLVSITLMIMLKISIENVHYSY